MKAISARYVKFIIVLFLFLIFNLSFVYADEIKVTKFIPDNINYTINSGKLGLNCIINDEGSYEIHGDMNTNGLEQGYYTSFIYENNNFDWSNYDGISFYIENMGEGSIDFNISILCNDGSRFTVSKEKVMLIKRENSDIIERAHLPYGALNINKGFIGNIYIPFDSLTLQNENKSTISLMKDFSKVSSWGISITSRENETKHFKISDCALINSNQNFNDYIKESFSIIGDDTAVIPEAGEYIYSYKLDNPKLQIKSEFNMSENYEDVEISKEGILTVGYNAEPQIITINVLQEITNNRTVGEVKTINLVRSWNHDRTYEDGISMAIPNEQNYSIMVSINNIALNRKITIAVRIICIGIVCGTAYICFTWFQSKQSK